MRAEIPHQGIPKGAALGAPLVTFPATGKSPGVGGAERPLMGRSAEDGAQPLLALVEAGALGKERKKGGEEG